MDSDECSIEPSFCGDNAAERTLWLALGYVEAACFLCNALIEDEFSREYRSTRVVLHLAHHAIELFLKGAMMERGQLPRATHDIWKLYFEYRKVYQGAAFHLEIPFELPGPETAALFPEIAMPKTLLDDQKYRYATARDGRCFDDRETFDGRSQLEQIQRLNKQMTCIYFRFRERRNKGESQNRASA